MEVDLARGRWSPSTRSAYGSFWRDWCAWCEDCDAGELPSAAGSISSYLQNCADRGLATASISGRLAAILAINALYGNTITVKATCIRDTWAEIRRAKGTASTPKLALDDKAIKKIIAGMPPEAIRDRAVILFAFSSLMRRSEIAALDMDALSFSDTALIVTIRRSKTDKAGKGEDIAIRRTGTKLCPVAALEAYHKAAGITTGAVFRNQHNERMAGREVADIGKRWASKAGFDHRLIGAHSFRRGGITSMFRNGAKLEDIMRCSRHVSPSIAMGYVAKLRAEENPATAALGI